MKSLRFYLRSRLLLLGLVVSLPIILLVFSLYELGLDDATEGYLKEDIKYAKHQLNKKGILPEETEFRMYFLGLDTLPAPFKKAVNNPRYFPYYIWQTEKAIYYGLSEPFGGERLYVFHKFSLEEGIIGIQLETIILGFICLILILMIVGASLIYRRIAKSMTYLNEISHSSQILNSNHDQAEFTEIKHISQALKASIAHLEKKATHERYFIQSLSHELRTPMAVIQVAVELLRKQIKSSGDNRISEKLSTIFNANLKMQSLSNNLLSLWSEIEHQEKSKINIKQVINQCIKELSQQYEFKSRLRVCFPDEDLIVDASLFAIELVLVNLIKNAIIHGDGDIEIKLAHQYIFITNRVSSSSTTNSESVGMGRFIIEQGVECLGWRLQVINNEFYRVEIKIFD